MKLLNQRFIMVKFKWSLRKWRFMVATMTWLTVTEYLCHKWPRKCSVCHNHICSHSWLITRFVTRVTRRVPHVLQELLTHEFTPVVSEVHVGQSLVFCVVYCRLSFVLLSSFFWPLCCLFFFDLRLLIIPFDHCIVCPSIYDFWLLLLTIVLSVLLRSTTSDYPFWPLHCLSFDLRLLITPWFLQVFLKKSYRNNGPGNDCRLWLEKCEELGRTIKIFPLQRRQCAYSFCLFAYQLKLL